jgi:hypothetical protein
MTGHKDEKWLDEELRRIINGSTPRFDAEAWKRKHAGEYETLLSRGRSSRPSARTLRLISGRRMGRLVAAALIVLAVGLLAPRRERPQPQEPVPPLVSSAGSMMSMMSLRTTYQQGGFDALDRQLQSTLDEFGPRSSGVSVQDLF